MKHILSTLVLTLVISPAFAGQSGFGVGGPDSYVWAEIDRSPLDIAASRTDQRNQGRIPPGGRMSPDLAPGSAFYGGFR
ncbi:MAG: hypothetical protein LJE91_14955 [Gammaproteobacteria bacterium]|jgi:hypothetical protein|nr:hypothetical protein [Gammaproteobacteria bacterium]